MDDHLAASRDGVLDHGSGGRVLAVREVEPLACAPSLGIAIWGDDSHVVLDDGFGACTALAVQPHEATVGRCAAARRSLDCGRIGPIAATDGDGQEREHAHRDPPYAQTHW